MKTLEELYQEAVDSYDEEVWELYREYAKRLVKDIRSNSHMCAARARMFVFMVGRGFSGIAFSITPWQGGKMDLSLLADELVKCIQDKLRDPRLPVDRLLDRLKRPSRIKGKTHWSMISKICHILWPDECPIYDTQVIYALGEISKSINDKTGNDFPVTRARWGGLVWDDYLKFMADMKLLFRKHIGKIRDFHHLDILLWYFGTEREISRLNGAIKRTF